MPEVILQNLPFLLRGLAATLQIAALTAVGGTLLGLGVGVAVHVRLPFIAGLLQIYIEFVRGMPLLVMLFICYFALPALLGLRMTAEQATILGFTLFIGAYIAEDIRSGLRSIPSGLAQAALATGLTRLQALRLVVVPLALRRIIPTLFNQYVRLLKFTSVASVIGVQEFTGSAMLVNARVFAPVTILAFVALTYLFLCLLLSSVGRVLHARLAV
ncbi:MAG: amino acid ABC transporter permease [Hyphomicrobiales bacterium]|nr:amino acid ABC transporter permease [Hyphomicrobiales bacterium]